MDKMKLSEEQLRELRYFIYKRGFREPEVMMEILDHFACKVEDKLSAKPGMSLEEAMKEAHNEFGYNGFYSIKASLDVFTRRKYKKIYLAEVKKTVTSVPHLLMLILIGWGTYSAMLWANDNNKVDWLMGHNLVSAILLLVILIAEFTKLIIVKKKYKNSYYLQIANSISYFNVNFSWIIIQWRIYSNHTTAVAMAILASVLVLLFAVNYISHYKMIRAAEKDYIEFQELEQKESLL